MNDVIRTIVERRSCKKYDSEKMLPETDLAQILEAGSWAASGNGKQSPAMVVVQDPETRDLLARLNAEVLGVSSDTFYGAPVVVNVFADSNVPTYVEDGSLVLGNLMVAATALDIGSCWIHRAKEVFQTEEGRALMEKWGLPENFVGVGHCVLGYAAGPLPKGKARKEGYIRYV